MLIELGSNWPNVKNDFIYQTLTLCYKFFNLSGGTLFWVILNCSIFALKVLEFYKFKIIYKLIFLKDFIVKDLIDDQNEANLSE